MKIMHGVREIAGQGIYSVQGLRQQGCDAKMLTWDRNAFGYPCDFSLEIDRKKKILYPWYAIKIFGMFLYAATHFDTFHFHFGYSLLPNNSDLWLLKLLHKQIVFEFHGTDLRQPSEIRKNNPYYSLDLSDEAWKTRRNKRVVRYAQHIVLHDEELIPYLPETKAQVHIVPLRVNIGRFEPEYPSPSANHIVIAHAPSNRAIKGSAQIIAAIERLSQKYDIEFVLIEKLTQEEAFKQYKRADIIVDQLILGTYGVFSIEAMALGKPVITYVSDKMRDSFPEELPIVSATVDNVDAVLETLIQDGALRNRLGIAGREYAERYHDYKNVARILSQIYDGKHQPVRGRKVFEEVL